MTGDQLARAATALVGVPFVLHGRDPRFGLDCVGVLAASYASLGRKVALPNGYALRTRTIPELSGPFMTIGMEPVTGVFETGTIRAGDVLMLRPSPCQLHLAIAATTQSFVHAHAALRKVVLGRIPVEWPLVGHWRLQSNPPR